MVNVIGETVRLPEGQCTGVLFAVRHLRTGNEHPRSRKGRLHCQSLDRVSPASYLA